MFVHCKSSEVVHGLRRFLPSGLTHADIAFACVGWPECPGDAVGPMVGTLLTKYGYDVVGTVDSPLSASSIPYYKAPAGKIVLAIDSLLGTTLERGMCQVSTNPLKPGAGVGKELPEIGDFHLAVCIGKNHGNSFFNNQELKFTSWNVISPLVNEVVQAIVQFVPPPLALDEVAAAQDF